MSENASYRAYFDFSAREGVPPQEQPRANLPKATEQAFIGHFGNLIVTHLRRQYPEFLDYLEYHDQVLDFIEPLQTVMSEACNQMLDMQLASLGYPPQELISREEAENRLHLREAVDYALKMGDKPDQDMHQHYLGLGMDKKTNYELNATRYHELIHEFAKPTEHQTMQRFIFKIFPMLEYEGDVPFN